MISRLIHLVEKLPLGAVTRRAAIEALADCWYERRSATIALLRVAVASISTLSFGRPFRNAGNDVRSAVRRLRAAPAFALFSIVSLAVGIGSTTAVYAVIRATLYQPTHVRDAERVMNIYGNDFEGRTAGWHFQLSAPDLDDVIAQQTSFSGITAWARFRGTLDGDTRAVVSFGESVRGNYFQVLGVPMALGRPLVDADNQPGAPLVMVLSDNTWTRSFNRDPGIVGRRIRLQGREVEVVGVAAPEFRGVDMPSVMPAMAWITISSADAIGVGRRRSADTPDRDDCWLMVKGRLKPGVDRAEASAELAAIGARLEAAYPRKHDTNDPRPTRYFTAFPSTELRMHESMHSVAGVFASLAMAFLAAVLLIACTNLANLQLGRFAGRRSEIAVRRAFGASRWQAMRVLAIEGMMLSAIGLVAGLLFAAWLMRVMTTAIDVVNGIVISVQPVFDLPVIAAAAACTVASMAIAGIVPAWHATRTSIQPSLSGAGGQQMMRWRGRRVVIAAQVAASVVLLAFAAVFANNAWTMLAANPGVDYGQLATLQFDLGDQPDGAPGSRIDQLGTVVDRVRSAPHVAAAGLADGLPISYSLRTFGVSTDPFDPNARNPRVKYMSAIGATPAAMSALGFRLQGGRALTPADDTLPVALITRGAALRIFGPADPVGRVLHAAVPTTSGGVSLLKPTELTIVGVIADVDIGTPGDRRYGLLVTPFDIAASQRPILVARLDDTAPDSAEWLRDIATKTDRSLPVIEARTGESLVSTQTLFARVGAVLTTTLGLMALLLGTAGLSGVMAHAVASRTREIGLRLALGAAPATVARAVIGDGLRPVLLGSLCGAGVAWLAVRFSGAMLGRLGGFPPAAALAIAGLMVCAAVAAGALPARRAARVDPNVALKDI